jgi:diacylglycerol kinase family enzyme
MSKAFTRETAPALGQDDDEDGPALPPLPAGTRNNVARSLGIPMRLPEAVRALRTGRRQAIGAGHAQVGDSERWFLETFTLGLFSAMFPHADAIQKGDLLRVRSLLASFLTAPQSRILIDVDDGDERIELKAHAVLGVNMPLTGANFRLGADIAYDDEHIDIFLYDRLDKLDFLFYGLDVITGVPEDPAIARLRARKAVLRAEPPLPVMADGFALGTGDVTVHMEHAALAVMTPHASSPPAPRPE